MKFEVPYKKFDKEDGEYKRTVEIYDKELTLEQKEIYEGARDRVSEPLFFMSIIFGVFAVFISFMIYYGITKNTNFIPFLIGELTMFIFSMLVPSCFYIEYRQNLKLWKETESDIINSIQKELQDEQKKIAEEYYKEHPEKFMAIYKLKED